MLVQFSYVGPRKCTTFSYGLVQFEIQSLNIMEWSRGIQGLVD